MKKFLPDDLTPEEIERFEKELASLPELPEESENTHLPHIFSGLSLIGFNFTGIISGNNSDFDDLISEGEGLTKHRKDIMIVEEYLHLRGFVHKDGYSDYVRFYNAARIGESTWSKYYSGTVHQNSTSKDTVFKIIIALRMSLDDAMLFIQYTGAGFFSRSKRDMVIYAFIKSNYLGRDNTFDAVATMYELLNYYAKANPDEPIKQLYKL